MASPTFTHWKCPECDYPQLVRGPGKGGFHLHQKMGKTEEVPLVPITKEEYEQLKRTHQH